MKDSKRIMLVDTLSKVEKEDAIDFSYELGFDLDTTLTANNFSEEFAKAILDDPRAVLSQLPLIDLETIKSLKDVNDGSNTINIYENHYPSLLVVNGLAQERRDGYKYGLQFGEDFREAALPIIDEVMDDKEVVRRLTIESIVSGLANLYGQVTHGMVKRELVRTKIYASEEEADSIIIEAWKHSILLKWMACPENVVYYKPTDSMPYVSRYGWSSPSDLKQEVTKHDSVAKDYRLFTQMDIVMAAREPLPLIPNPMQEKFTAFLRDNFNLHKWEVLEICHDIWFYAMHKGDAPHSQQNPADYFDECVLKPQEADEELRYDAFHLLDDYLNQMPHWQLKGHTPAETGDLLEHHEVQ